MRRSLGLLVFTMAVMWALLLFDMGSSTRALELASSSVTPAVDSPASTPPPTDRSWSSRVVARATRVFSPPPPIAGATRPAPSSTPETQATGELGPADRSPEFKALHARYARETRDGGWAFEQEQRIRALFANHPLAAHVALLNCQTTVCRLVLEGDAPDLVAQLWYVPNLRRETGLRPDSPYSLRSGQLSLYFQRAELPYDDEAEQASKTSR
jgi:hypothetical protein